MRIIYPQGIDPRLPYDDLRNKKCGPMYGPHLSLQLSIEKSLRFLLLLKRNTDKVQRAIFFGAYQKLLRHRSDVKATHGSIFPLIPRKMDDNTIAFGTPFLIAFWILYNYFYNLWIAPQIIHYATIFFILCQI